MLLSEKWRLNRSIKLLRIGQSVSISQPATVEYRVSPTMSASYLLRKKASIEAEINVEISNTNNSLGHARNFSEFSFIGYRLGL